MSITPLFIDRLERMPEKNMKLSLNGTNAEVLTGILPGESHCFKPFFLRFSKVKPLELFKRKSTKKSS